MQFDAPNDFPGLYERRKDRLQKNNFFFWQPKMGVVHQGVIHQALQYSGPPELADEDRLLADYTVIKCPK